MGEVPRADHMPNTSNRRTVEHIACETKRRGIATQHHRKVFDGLLSEFRRLRSGKGTNCMDKAQLPVKAINTMLGEVQFTHYNGYRVSFGNGVAIVRLIDLETAVECGYRINQPSETEFLMLILIRPKQYGLVCNICCSQGLL